MLPFQKMSTLRHLFLQRLCSGFSKWYHWYDWLTNGTNCTIGRAMYHWHCHWYKWYYQCSIGKTLNDIGIPLVPVGNPEHAQCLHNVICSNNVYSTSAVPVMSTRRRLFQKCLHYIVCSKIVYTPSSVSTRSSHP